MTANRSLFGIPSDTSLIDHESMENQRDIGFGSLWPFVCARGRVCLLSYFNLLTSDLFFA